MKNSLSNRSPILCNIRRSNSGKTFWQHLSAQVSGLGLVHFCSGLVKFGRFGASFDRDTVKFRHWIILFDSCSSVWELYSSEKTTERGNSRSTMMQY